METPDRPTSDIAETVERTLEELGVRDAAGLEELFAQLERRLREDVAQLAAGAQRANGIEHLRVRWLGRKQGIVRSITENWLRSAPPGLKADVGKRLNALRAEAERQIVSGPQTISEAGNIASAEKFGTPQILQAEELDITLTGRRRAVSPEGIRLLPAVDYLRRLV